LLPLVRGVLEIIHGLALAVVTVDVLFRPMMSLAHQVLEAV